jgi:molybdopterin biosynthesis enzyme
MMGRTVLNRPERQAVLADPLRKPLSDARTHFLRVLLREEGGTLVAQLNGPQGSGLLTSMTRSQALLVVPGEAHDLPGGASVTVRMTDLAEDH